MQPEAEHEKRYHAGAERLRAPDRVALLEVRRVVGLCTEGLTVDSVLDVGTGTGLFAESFARGTPNVAGLDANPEFLALARSLVPGARFVEGIAEKLPFPDTSFDLVFLGLVLHETYRPADALKEARRVARLRVGVLEWPYVSEERGPPLAHRLQPFALTALARSAGFRTVERLTLSHLELYRLQ